MDSNICVSATDVHGLVVNIQIRNDRIQSLSTDCEAAQVFDLSDTVVLPQIIDAHNHPLPYNLSSSKNLMGDHQEEMGHFISRFQWNSHWRTKSDQILAQQKDFQDKNPDKTCDLFYYATMLDVGAAVIQGFDPPYYESCMAIAGDALGRTNPSVSELVWLWKPGDYKDGKTPKRVGEVEKFLKGDVRVAHLAEGSANDFNIQQEISIAYYEHALDKPGGVYIHGTGFSDADLQIIKKNNGGLVWSPVSQFALYGEVGILDIRRVLGAGLAVGLGSDWSLTGSPNILREMAFAQKILVAKFGYSSQEAAHIVLQMATVQNARLLGLSVYSGINPGNVASLTFVKKSAIFKDGNLDLSSLDESNVRLSLHRGNAVFGDTDLVQRLRKDASPLRLSEECHKKGIFKSVAPATGGDSLEIVHERLRAHFPEIPDIVRCETMSHPVLKRESQKR